MSKLNWNKPLQTSKGDKAVLIGIIPINFRGYKVSPYSHMVLVDDASYPDGRTLRFTPEGDYKFSALKVVNVPLSAEERLAQLQRWLEISIQTSCFSGAEGALQRSKEIA